MTRLFHAWRAMEPEQRLGALASAALLITMFLPWYGLQSANRKTGIPISRTISAFGDVSFVEAAVFLVAVGVGILVFARAEGREFHLPGGDGAIVTLAGAWAGLLIFYRVFSRPPGDGYPVGIEWGFFLAFMAAGGLAYSGWRMRGIERPEPPAGASRRPRRAAPSPAEEQPASTVEAAQLVPAAPQPPPGRATPVPAERRPSSKRSPYPPAPSWTPSRPAPPEAEQLSFEDSPPGAER
jgi:hypothetical protein